MQPPHLPPQIDRASASQPAPSGLNVASSIHTQPQVRHLPQPQLAPAWLRSLLTAQHRAMVLFASVLGLSTLVYGCTVYTQSLWRSQHSLLQRLRLQESQQGMMNEHLKQQMAQAAEEPKNGLIAPSPHSSVFVTSAPPRPTKPLPVTLASPSTPLPLPSGY